MIEAFTEASQEFRTGDKVQFTRNNEDAGRINSRTASIIAVAAKASSMMIERTSGERQMLNLDHPSAPAGSAPSTPPRAPRPTG